MGDALNIFQDLDNSNLKHPLWAIHLLVNEKPIPSGSERNSMRGSYQLSILICNNLTQLTTISLNLRDHFQSSDKSIKSLSQVILGKKLSKSTVPPPFIILRISLSIPSSFLNSNHLQSRCETESYVPFVDHDTSKPVSHPLNGKLIIVQSLIN